jgi:hypothetical protein
MAHDAVREIHILTHGQKAGEESQAIGAALPRDRALGWRLLRCGESTICLCPTQESLRGNHVVPYTATSPRGGSRKPFVVMRAVGTQRPHGGAHCFWRISVESGEGERLVHQAVKTRARDLA